eukprot:c49833_g1_i1 orf=2-271(+)
MDKAYDIIKWSYILEGLERMGLGPNFLRMVLALFGNASTSVLVNDYPSGSYALNRSIRKGCPLAPLLYAVIMEPLMALFAWETTLGYIR